MAPTTAPEEGGESSGSRSSRAIRRERRLTPAVSPAPPMRITRSRMTKSEPPPPPKSSRPPKEGSKKRERLEPPPPAKRSRRASKSNTVEVEEEVAVAAAAASASPAAEEASSAVSSPRRCPYIPRVVERVDSSGREIFQPYFKIDPLIISAYEELKDKYNAKQARDLKLPSLDPNVPSSCFEYDERLLPVRASATKTILQISKVVLSLSSYLGDSLLARSSGFVIDWDADSESRTILTSALLIRSKSPSPDEWSARDEYAPHAKVYVHLLDDDDTDEEAKLLFYNKHYNIALFRTTTDLSGQIPAFSSEVNCAQEVFVLGRDESRYLSIDHGYVDSRGPSYCQRHHYMYATCNAEKAAIGGAVINTHGEILGMISSLQLGFIPSSIILKCLRMWKKFDCIPRLHVGMKLSTIIFLDPIHIEKISRKCGIDDGLIVKEVSEGSVAEELGIKAGDIIKRWNRKKISTTVELENFLLCLCEKHLDKKNVMGSNLDLLIDIFHVRKRSNDTIKLTVYVSNDVEKVTEGTYAVTKDNIRGHDDHKVHGEEASHGINDEEDGDTKKCTFSKETNLRG